MKVFPVSLQRQQEMIVFLNAKYSTAKTKKKQGIQKIGENGLLKGTK
jgi:hypothetical protein